MVRTARRRNEAAFDPLNDSSPRLPGQAKAVMVAGMFAFVFDCLNQFRFRLPGPYRKMMDSGIFVFVFVFN